MKIDNELPALRRLAVEAPSADRSSPARQNRAAKTDAGSKSTFSNVAEAVNGKSNGEVGVAKPEAKTNGAKTFHAWQDGDFSIGDFLDIVNPMQHLPIVATIYRNLTGDQIGMVPRVIGGALWGRIGGFIAGIVNSVVEWFSGKDIGDHIYSAIWGTPETKPETTVAAPSKDLPVAPLRNVSSTSSETLIAPAARAPEVSGEMPLAVSPPTATPASKPPSPADSVTSSRRAMPAIELVPNHVLLHRYRSDEERNDSDYEKKLRVTA